MNKSIIFCFKSETDKTLISIETTKKIKIMYYEKYGKTITHKSLCEKRIAELKNG